MTLTLTFPSETIIKAACQRGWGQINADWGEMSIKPGSIRGFLRSSQEACLNPQYRFKGAALIPLLDSLADTAGYPLELTGVMEKFLEHAVVEETARRTRHGAQAPYGVGGVAEGDAGSSPCVDAFRAR